MQQFFFTIQNYSEQSVQKQTLKCHEEILEKPWQNAIKMHPTKRKRYEISI
jgi:hypothetical protein